MGQKKKNAAQRGKKKHEKEKKRAKKLEERRKSSPEVRPVRTAEELWRPAAEGIEGLARRKGWPGYDAALRADALAAGDRPEAQVCWLPSRVRALSTDQILDELAARGVITNGSAFAALAEGASSSWALAQTAWWPLLGPEQGPHDRDLLGVAATELWRRWLPEVVSDERLCEAMDDINNARLSGADLVGRLLDLWGVVQPLGGLSRLEQARIHDAFVEALDDTLTWENDEDYSAFVPELREIAAQATLGDPFRASLEVTIWRYSSPDEREATLSALLAEGQDEPWGVRLAGALLLAVNDATPAQLEALDRALQAAQARRDALMPMLRVDLEDMAEDLAERLAASEGGAGAGDGERTPSGPG